MNFQSFKILSNFSRKHELHIIPSHEFSSWEVQKINWVKIFHIRSKISICARLVELIIVQWIQKSRKKKLNTYFITTEEGVNSDEKIFTLRYRYEEQKVLKFSNFQRTKNFHLMGLWWSTFSQTSEMSIRTTPVLNK